MLQNALDVTVKRFPSIAARLRKGAFMLLIEFLMGVTFHLRFIGWSVYPLCVLLLFGGMLIFLVINSLAREMIERKLFF